MASNVFGIEPEEGSEAHREAQEAAGSPATTPDEKATTDKQTEEPTPEPQDPPQADPAPEPEKPEGEAEEEEEGISEDGTGFRIGNKVYKDIMAADHAFRQQRGRAQAEARRAKELESERQRLLEENARLKAQAPVPPSQTPPVTDPTPAQPAVEEDARLTQPLTREQINELIAEEGADAALEKVQEIAEKRMMELLDARTEPLRQQEEIAEAQQVASENFFNVSQITGADGKPLFPALAEDAPTAPEIVAVWDQLVMEDPDFRAIALTPAGAKFAYREWERLHAASTSEPATTSQPAPSPAPSTPSGQADQNRALQSMSQGQQSPPPPDPNRPPSGPSPASAEEAVRKLVEARRHSVFGVTVEDRVS